ncbi:MAG: hypothetical protein AABW53_00120 [Nanoarchaeota archaeon]
MAKTKKMPPQATVNKSVKKSKAPIASVATGRDKGLNMMVQLNEPKNLRKDILEALREIIIFMQGYEAFRKIQEEKVATFSQLREDVKVLNSLIDTKLRRYLPKGKLAGVVKKPVVKKEEPEEREIPAPREMPMMRSAPKPEPKKESDELDELESQLQDIEGRLRRIN